LKKLRFTDSQIIAVLKQAEAGVNLHEARGGSFSSPVPWPAERSRDIF